MRNKAITKNGDTDWIPMKWVLEETHGADRICLLHQSKVLSRGRSFECRCSQMAEDRDGDELSAVQCRDTTLVFLWVWFKFYSIVIRKLLCPLEFSSDSSGC